MLQDEYHEPAKANVVSSSTPSRNLEDGVTNASGGAQRRTALQEAVVVLDGRNWRRLVSPVASRRGRDLLELLDWLSPTIAELTQTIEQEAVEKCPAARRLRTHPGVGSLTARLAFVLIIGRAERFQWGAAIASYLDCAVSEEPSGDRRRLGHISKQGNTLLRFLLVEAAQVTVRSLPEWREQVFSPGDAIGEQIAKVAMARKLAIQLYWMMQAEWIMSR